jgi:RecG-like helicase
MMLTQQLANLLCFILHDLQAGLLLHFPTSYIDRRKSCPVSEAVSGEVLTLILSVQYTVDAGYGSRAANRVICIDKYGTEIELLYFFNYTSAGARAAWQAVKAQMPIGSTKVVSGKVLVLLYKLYVIILFGITHINTL